ncbi:hypothetical protein ACE2AJ_07205 [Aquihabitans daechungensis]|uniref:hypothetical protein n=1 Tax=Aquihabitans daechungensis TaxID=1052257 RepID=UPI003BA33A5A
MTAPELRPEPAPDGTDGADGADAVGTGASERPVPGEGVTRPPRPSLWAVGGWLLLVGLAVALDGPVGGFTMVAIAAVLLAGLPTRLIGGLGVLLLALTPVAIILEGIPTDREISPEFVTRSLLPHHLAFAGLVLVGAFALIDLAPHLRDWAAAERPPQDDGPPFGTVIGAVLVALVAVGALLACRAVLGA